MLQRAAMMVGQVDDAIAQRQTSEASGWSLWGRLLGGKANRDAKSGTESYNVTTAGLAVGADARIGNDWLVGGAFSWMNGWNGGKGLFAGDANGVASYQLNAYAAWTKGALHLYADAAAGRDRYNQHRAMSYLAEGAQASYDGYHYALSVGGDYAIPMGSVTVSPTAKIDWLGLHRDHYAETGAGTEGLRVSSFFGNQLESGLGAKLAWNRPTSLGLLVPEIKVLWAHDFVNGATGTDADLGGIDFTTRTARIAPNGAKIGVDLALYRNDGLSFRIGYGGDFRSGYTANTADIRFGIAF